MSAAVRDLVSGAVVLIFCITIYLLIPTQVVIEETGGMTAASVPAILLFTIGALATLLLVRGVAAVRAAPSGGTATNGMTDKATDRKGLAYAAVAAAGLVVYVAAISWLGYLLSTALALCFLTLLFGQRVYWKILVLMAVAPPILFYFFRYTMFVLLPQGRLFE